MTENLTVWKSNNHRVKEEIFIQTGRGAGMGSQVERIHGKAKAGGRVKQVDGSGCGEVVAGRVAGPTFECR